MVKDQKITDNYAVYNGDCVEVMGDFEDNMMDMVIYSPPFSSMYTYSSDDRDLGNCRNYEEFLEHYLFVVKQVHRITKPGRIVAVHCMDIPRKSNAGLDDFPGDIIKMHQDNGFYYWDRKQIWKEPLRVAIRTRLRALMHQQVAKDTLMCRGALADYLLLFKKKGENKVPVVKPHGFTEYDGDLELMKEFERLEYESLLKKYKNWTDDKTNRLSQFIWRRYASSEWNDIRANRCISYKEARDPDDDRHCCPIQLDIVTRSVVMYTNPEEVVFTPFAGVGSEVYGAVINNRKGMGSELKESYYNQTIKNLDSIENNPKENQLELF